MWIDDSFFIVSEFFFFDPQMKFSWYFVKWGWWHRIMCSWKPELTFRNYSAELYFPSPLSPLCYNPLYGDLSKWVISANARQNSEGRRSFGVTKRLLLNLLWLHNSWTGFLTCREFTQVCAESWFVRPSLILSLLFVNNL